MSKQIIILEVASSTPQELSIRYILWIPTQFPILRPNAQSLWQGASVDEIAAIRDGTVIEEAHTKSFPSSLTVPAIKNHLVEHYRSRVAYFQSMPRPGQYYGIYFDGTNWSG